MLLLFVGPFGIFGAAGQAHPKRATMADWSIDVFMGIFAIIIWL